MDVAALQIYFLINSDVMHIHKTFNVIHEIVLYIIQAINRATFGPYKIKCKKSITLHMDHLTN